MTATRHIRRLQSMAERKRQLAIQLRNADNTARGERDACEADWDAAALEWATACHAELTNVLEAICEELVDETAPFEALLIATHAGRAAIARAKGDQS